MLFIAQILYADETQLPTESTCRPVTQTAICLLSGAPPPSFKYIALRRLVVGKGSYGRVNDILPKFVRIAKDRGADAIINYYGSQRFGFWPWRIVRPVVQGTPIKWDPNNKAHFDCIAFGGIYR